MLRKLSQLLSSLLISFIVALPLLAVPATAESSQPQTADFSQGYLKNSLEVKFTPNSGVVIENGKLSGDPEKVEQISKIIGKTNQKSSKKLFKDNPVAKRTRTEKAKRATGNSVPSLDNYTKIELNSDVVMADVVEDLENLGFIESAFPTMLPAPAPAVPDYNNLQTHLRKTTGLNADFAHQIDGGLGKNVRIVDLEYSWNIDHTELKSVDQSDQLYIGEYENPFTDTNHGTAVASILVGEHDGHGINGIAPKADLKLVNTYSNDYGWDIANSIYHALDYMTAGDVMLIEQQAYGPTPAEYDYVPVEIIPSVYDAIVTATSMGIIVVEPAGNGAQNLNDTTYYGNKFPFGKPNSGAIVVGAVNSCIIASPNVRSSFSTYGSRVDVYADGSCVPSGGYGSLYSAEGPNSFYTSGFSGTSSASAVTAGAVALVSSAAQEVGNTMTPAQIRTAIKSTGIPQDPQVSGNIGVKPQIREAILANNRVNITSCYTGGYGENFFLYIAKNHFKIASPAQTQSFTALLLGNAYKDKAPGAPVAFNQTGNKCYTSSYNGEEMIKIEGLANFTSLDYSDAQAYSAVLVGYIVVLWTH